MKFTKQSMIDALDRKIAAELAAANGYDDKLKAAQEAHRKAWFERNEPKMRELRDMLSRHLKNRTVVRGGWRSEREIPTYSEYSPESKAAYNLGVEPVGPKPGGDVTEWVALRAVLAASVDDVITQAELERAGYRNLRPIFIAAAAAEEDSAK